MFIVWLALDGGLEEKLAICIALVPFITVLSSTVLRTRVLTIVILCT